jgi:putative membrane protein
VSRFLVHWLVVAIALWAAAWILPGVAISSWPALVVASLVLGLVNAVVRPILVLLTLPITLLTLGLFYLVVNGAAFALSAWLVPGFAVGGCGWAIVGALVVSTVSWFIGLFVGVDDHRD